MEQARPAETLRSPAQFEAMGSDHIESRGSLKAREVPSPRSVARIRQRGRDFPSFEQLEHELVEGSVALAAA